MVKTQLSRFGGSNLLNVANRLCDGFKSPYLTTEREIKCIFSLCSFYLCGHSAFHSDLFIVYHPNTDAR